MTFNAGRLVEAGHKRVAGGRHMASVPPEPVPARLRVPKMAELVAGELRRQIVSRDLAGGDALASEADLMTRFGISRPTLREAFRVLESEGLIGVRRGAHGGARGKPPNATSPPATPAWCSSSAAPGARTSTTPATSPNRRARPCSRTSGPRPI